MFAYQEPRIYERSRFNYSRDLLEFARLEFPDEDPCWVSLRAIDAAAEPEPARRRFHLFRRVEGPSQVARGNV
jgi:hypothetical protein